VGTNCTMQECDLGHRPDLLLNDGPPLWVQRGLSAEREARSLAQKECGAMGFMRIEVEGGKVRIVCPDVNVLGIVIGRDVD
jgi:hypothetical protein